MEKTKKLIFRFFLSILESMYNRHLYLIKLCGKSEVSRNFSEFWCFEFEYFQVSGKFVRASSSFSPNFKLLNKPSLSSSSSLLDHIPTNW